MKVRRAIWTDAAALAAVEATQPRAAGWGESGFATELTQTYSAIWCAYENETKEIMGFIALRGVAGHAEILNFAVRADQTQRGIGRGLLKHVLAYLELSGKWELSLEVAQDNMIACALYEQAGLKQLGVRKDFYGPGKDGLIYGKKI